MKGKKWSICKGCGKSIQLGEYCVECLSQDISLLPTDIKDKVLQPDKTHSYNIVGLILRLTATLTMKPNTILKLTRLSVKKLLEGKEEEVLELLQQIEDKKLELNKAIKILEKIDNNTKNEK